MTASNAFTLPSGLGIRNVAETAQELLKYDSGGDIVLDAAHLEDITTPGLQLLAACWQRAKQQETAFTLTNSTEALQRALDMAGLNYLLD